MIDIPPADRLAGDQGEVRGPLPRVPDELDVLLLHEQLGAAVQQPQGASGAQLRDRRQRDQPPPGRRAGAGEHDPAAGRARLQEEPEPLPGTNLDKAKQLDQESGHRGQTVTVWGDPEDPTKKTVEYEADVLNKIGYKAKVKIVPAETYFTTIGNRSVKAQTGWANWFQDYPHPADFIDVLLNPDRVVATGNNNYSYNADDKQLATMINDAQRGARAHARGDQQVGRGRQVHPGEGVLGASTATASSRRSCPRRMDFANCKGEHSVYTTTGRSSASSSDRCERLGGTRGCPPLFPRPWPPTRRPTTRSTPRRTSSPRRATPGVIEGMSPWRLAMRRLRRNRVALFFLRGLPLHRHRPVCSPRSTPHWVGNTPDKNNLTGKFERGGKQVFVVIPDGIPVGPGLTKKYLLGADNNGRDVDGAPALRRAQLAARSASSRRSSPLFGAVVARPGVRLLPRRVDRGISSFFDIIWSFPVLLLAIGLGTALAIGGLNIGPDPHQPATRSGCPIARHRGRRHPLPRPSDPRPGALAAREGVHRGGDRPGHVAHADHVLASCCPTSPRRSSSSARWSWPTTSSSRRHSPSSAPASSRRTPSWGNLISDGIERLITAPHLTIVPGLAIVLTVLSLNIFGDGLRDALDPRAKVRHALMLRFTVKRLDQHGVRPVRDLRDHVLRSSTCSRAAAPMPPRERIAGKNVNQTLVQQIKKDYGFNDPIYIQYVPADEEDDQRRPGVLLQPGQRPRAADRGHPAHGLAGASAPRSSGSSSGSCFGRDQRGDRREVARPGAHDRWRSSASRCRSSGSRR